MSNTDDIVISARSLPMKDRISHKVWKVRSEAYVDLKKKIETSFDDDDSIYDLVGSNLPNIVTEKIIPVLEDSLSLAVAFIKSENSSSLISKYCCLPDTRKASELKKTPKLNDHSYFIFKMNNLVLKTSKQTDKSFTIVEAIAQNGFLADVVVAHLASFNCTKGKTLFYNIVNQLFMLLPVFGLDAIDWKKIVKAIPTLFEAAGRYPTVRDKGKELAAYMMKFGSPKINAYLSENLTKFQFADVEKTVSSIPDSSRPKDSTSTSSSASSSASSKSSSSSSTTANTTAKSTKSRSSSTVGHSHKTKTSKPVQTLSDVSNTKPNFKTKPHSEINKNDNFNNGESRGDKHFQEPGRSVTYNPRVQLQPQSREVASGLVSRLPTDIMDRLNDRTSPNCDEIRSETLAFMNYQLMMMDENSVPITRSLIQLLEKGVKPRLAENNGRIVKKVISFYTSLADTVILEEASKLAETNFGLQELFQLMIERDFRISSEVQTALRAWGSVLDLNIIIDAAVPTLNKIFPQSNTSGSSPKTTTGHSILSQSANHHSKHGHGRDLSRNQNHISRILIWLHDFLGNAERGLTTKYSHFFCKHKYPELKSLVTATNALVPPLVIGLASNYPTLESHSYSLLEMILRVTSPASLRKAVQNLPESSLTTKQFNQIQSRCSTLYDIIPLCETLEPEDLPDGMMSSNKTKNVEIVPTFEYEGVISILSNWNPKTGADPKQLVSACLWISQAILAFQSRHLMLSIETPSYNIENWWLNQISIFAVSTTSTIRLNSLIGAVNPIAKHTFSHSSPSALIYKHILSVYHLLFSSPDLAGLLERNVTQECLAIIMQHLTILRHHEVHFSVCGGSTSGTNSGSKSRTKSFDTLNGSILDRVGSGSRNDSETQDSIRQQFFSVLRTIVVRVLESVHRLDTFFVLCYFLETVNSDASGTLIPERCPLSDSDYLTEFHKLVHKCFCKIAKAIPQTKSILGEKGIRALSTHMKTWLNNRKLDIKYEENLPNSTLASTAALYRNVLGIFGN